VSVLDGDKVRHGLCADLGFSLPERSKTSAASAKSRLFHEAGQIVLVSAISPLRADRERARALIPAPSFIEVHCRCPLALCAACDPQGL